MNVIAKSLINIKPKEKEGEKKDEKIKTDVDRLRDKANLYFKIVRSNIKDSIHKKVATYLVYKGIDLIKETLDNAIHYDSADLIKLMDEPINVVNRRNDANQQLDIMKKSIQKLERSAHGGPSAPGSRAQRKQGM